MTCPILKPTVDVLIAHRDEFASFLLEEECWERWKALSNEQYVNSVTAKRRATAALNIMCTFTGTGVGSVALTQFMQSNDEAAQALMCIQSRAIVETNLEDVVSSCKFFEREVTLTHGMRALDGVKDKLRNAAEWSMAQRVGCIYKVALELHNGQVTEESGLALGAFLVGVRSPNVMHRCIEQLLEIA